MGKIRILSVDDAVVIRRMVTDILSSDPALEVVGTAPNGRIGLAKIPQVNPDLVILDVEMPEMDGLQTLAALRATYPRLPVIMFSTLTERGAAATLEALALGASDYVIKPANVGNVSTAIQRIREQLIPKIKALCPGVLSALRLPAIAKVAAEPPRPTPRPAPTARGQVEVVVIGVSTGGPNALAEVLPKLPANFPVPVLIVQHMPPIFTKLLAQRLASRCALQVEEAAAGEVLTPGKAWVAPGDYHLRVVRNGLVMQTGLHQGPQENSCRPAVDVLFRSAAEAYGAGVLGIVMTGMGQDGLRGAESIVEAGGQMLAQDEATSVVWGMPGFVARAGLAQMVLPLTHLGPEIVRRAMRGRTLLGFPNLGEPRTGPQVEARNSQLISMPNSIIANDKPQ